MDSASSIPQVILVLVTYPSADEAMRISSVLVEERLVACVNVLQAVRSLFFWDRALHDETEVLAVAKTTLDRLDAVVQRVKSLHSYSVPEVIGLPILGGSEDYLRWVKTAMSS